MATTPTVEVVPPDERARFAVVVRISVGVRTGEATIRDPEGHEVGLVIE